jgi:hypothetical protein
MADISINLREISPELEGRPSFSAFLKRGILDGVVGVENLGRIQAFGIVYMLDVETRILTEVAHSGGTYDGMDLRQHNIGGFILPIVRVASDFEPEEEVAVRPPSKNSYFEARKVWAIEQPYWNDHAWEQLDDEEGKLDERGRVLVGASSTFDYSIAPNWPGIIPANIAHMFEKKNRDMKRHIDGIRVSLIAGFFFRSSFFDPEFSTDDRFEDMCYSGLRHYRLGMPKRLIN